MLAFKILGAVKVLDDGRELTFTDDGLALVARLLLADTQPVPASYLTADLWPSLDDAAALGRLRAAVDELCAGPLAAHVTAVPPGFAIDAGAADVDAVRFDALVAEAAKASGRDDTAAAAALDAALALWEGEPAAELAARGVARAERRRLADARLVAAEERARLALASADLPGAPLLALLDELAAAAPVRERLWCLRADLLDRAGRRAEAASTLTDLRERLASVLGVEPGPETAALEARLHADVPPPGAPAPDRPGRAPATPFVGRWRELAVLERAWQTAVAGQRSSVFLGGEPGIGKTRLASELAASAAASGGTVVYGRCDEDLGVAYQPFVEALGALLVAQPGLLGDELRRVTADLARLLPDLASLARQLPPPVRAGPEAERWALFEAVVTLLAAASQRAPLVLVLDDLQWAATPTVLLLQHVMRTSRPLRLLVVGTYRDTELDRNPKLGELFADLAVDGTAERLQLGGLGVDDVASLVGDLLDSDDAGLARTVHDETDGNPFFVQELLRHLLEAGGERRAPALPPGVREVVARRLDRLSPAVNRMLAVAAIVGPVFTVDVLERLPDVAGEPNVILDAVDEALAAKLVEELPSGALRFSHELVRHTVHDSLSSARRMRLHRRVGEVLERMPDRPGRLEALAFHFGEAAADGLAAKAAGYALDAGRHLTSRLAYEGAATMLERGLAALEGDPAPDRALRADLLLALGTARANAGDTTGAKEAGLRAADDARAVGSAERLAEAAEVCSSQTGVGVVDPNVSKVCEDALAGLVDGDPMVRARLMARFAFYQASNESRGEAAAPLAEQAIALARAAGDTEALAAALFGRAVALLGSDRADQRLALAGELLALAAETDNQEERLQGLFLRGSARLELGDRSGFEADAAELGALAARVPSFKARYYDTAWRVMRTILDGRFDATAARLDELAGMAGTDANARNVHAINSWLLFRETGRIPEMLPLLEDVVARNPALVGFQPALAVSFVDVGRNDDARALLERLVDDDCAVVTRDMNWVASLGGLAEVAAALQREDAAVVLEAHLAAHAGRVVVPAAATFCIGTTDRFLGMLAGARGDDAAASGRFASALALEEAIGAPPLATRTRLWFARHLAAGGDTAGAAALAAEAESSARELGMATVLTEATALRATLGKAS